VDIKGVIGLVVLIGVCWGIVKIKQAMTRGVNRAVVHRGDYKKEQSLTQTMTRFEARSSRAALVEKIHQAVPVASQLPTAITADLVAVERDEGLRWVYGNRIAEQFTAVLSLTQSDDGVIVGQFRFAEWTQTDGVVASTTVAEMERLLVGVTAAFRAVDPDMKLSTVTTG
jgi:hypothetical protein